MQDQHNRQIPCFLEGEEWWPHGQFTIEDATSGKPRPTVASVTEADVPKLLASSAAAYPCMAKEVVRAGRVANASYSFQFGSAHQPMLVVRSSRRQPPC